MRFNEINSGLTNLENVMHVLQEGNIFNYFCADVQVRGEYPAFINRYFKEHDINLEIQEGDLDLIKGHTVLVGGCDKGYLPHVSSQ